MPYNIIYLDKIPQLDGAEMSLFDTVKGLDGDKFKFQVILPCSGPFEQKLKKHSLSVKTIKRRKIRMSINPLYYIMLSITLMHFTLCLVRIIKKENIRLVCANSLHDVIYAGLAAKFTRTPLLCHIREILPCNWKWNIWVKLIGFFSNKIITASDAVKETLAKDQRALNKAETVYVGFDIDRFKPENKGDRIRQEFGIEDNDFLVVNIGALISWKGHELFLKVAQRIVKALPQTKFMIVGIPFWGKDDYMEYLKKLTQELGLEANVIFTGFRDDIPRILEAADLYVHSAVLPDPFPRVLLEAMASGKPVVAPCCGGIPELIDDNVNGKLYPAGDIEAMTMEIMSLLKNSELRRKLGLAARSHIQENFTLKKYIKKMKRVYCELLSIGP